MDTKTCKECGKIFTPKSKRQQYCDALHFRPCPVCGKPVEAKYLSDPPTCCSKECRAAKANKTRGVKAPKAFVLPTRVFDSNPQQSSFLDNTETDEGARKFSVPYKCTRTFVGKERMAAFIPGHEYNLLIGRDVNDYSYTVEASYDVTDDTPVDIVIPLSSQISINQNFV